jgi:hypothetical protein
VIWLILQEYYVELTLTNRRVRRIHSAEVIRIAREDKQQSLAYTAQPFALCNLPARPLKDKSIYERKNGKYFLRIEAGKRTQGNRI